MAGNSRGITMSLQCWWLGSGNQKIESRKGFTYREAWRSKSRRRKWEERYVPDQGRLGSSRYWKQYSLHWKLRFTICKKIYSISHPQTAWQAAFWRIGSFCLGSLAERPLRELVLAYKSFHNHLSNLKLEMLQLQPAQLDHHCSPACSCQDLQSHSAGINCPRQL